MRYRYYTCDVFTRTRFGGNQLAVLPQAEGLSGAQMQQIAREFGYSETSFVLQPRAGHTRRVRIFTPTTELPFAGHPNVGTAFVLASTGELGEIGTALDVTFEEDAGLVPIRIEGDRGGGLWCELAAPERLLVGESFDPAVVAAAVSLTPDDIARSTHAPQVTSVGLPFLVTELRDRAALERARTHLDALEGLVAAGAPAQIHLYVRSRDEFDLRARMFAPLDGVPEDPATGSACCALVGLLTLHAGAADGHFHWRIGQGIEMGRPSLLEARTEKRQGNVVGTWIGGACVLVSEGFIEVGAPQGPSTRAARTRA